MQYLCYIVNLKFTPAIFYAVCANTQTVSKVKEPINHSVTGSAHRHCTAFEEGLQLFVDSVM